MRLLAVITGHLKYHRYFPIKNLSRVQKSVRKSNNHIDK